MSIPEVARKLTKSANTLVLLTNQQLEEVVDDAMSACQAAEAQGYLWNGDTVTEQMRAILLVLAKAVDYGETEIFQYEGRLYQIAMGVAYQVRTVAGMRRLMLRIMTDDYIDTLANYTWLTYKKDENGLPVVAAAEPCREAFAAALAGPTWPGVPELAELETPPERWAEGGITGGRETGAGEALAGGVAELAQAVRGMKGSISELAEALGDDGPLHTFRRRIGIPIEPTGRVTKTKLREYQIGPLGPLEAMTCENIGGPSGNGPT
jgi:hypothetical protein